MTNWWLLLLLPFIAASIGWFTNYIAIKMLFHPREPKKVLFFTFHGVFPKRQKQVAERIAVLVSQELLSLQDIQEQITNPDELEKVMGKIETKLGTYFNNTFPAKHPFLDKILTKKMKVKIQSEVLGEVASAAPGMIHAHVQEISGKLDIENLVRTKVAALSSKKLEEMIWSILDKEFKFIEVIGAIIGFIIGLLQSIMTYFLY